MNNLRKKREEFGMTLQEIADAVGVHFATVSDWELEKIIPRPKKKIVLSKVFGCSIEELFPDSAMSFEEVPKAICGEPDNPLKIGDIAIQCYVLEDGRRVLVQREMISALDMKYGSSGQSVTGSDRLVNFISAKSINPYINNDLSVLITNPIIFKTTRGSIAYGYEATALADLCDAVLESRKKRTLNHQQIHIADRCEILMRGFARVGIIALVDEVTGYQALRSRHALEEILDQFISKELRKWAKTFPDEFYREMFRLRGWQYVPLRLEKPAVVGKYTNDLVYERIAPGVLEELKKKNPKNDKGRRKYKHFQWLTEDVGHPRLREHLSAVIALMKASTQWHQFYEMVQRALPKYGDQLSFMSEYGEEGETIALSSH